MSRAPRSISSPSLKGAAAHPAFRSGNDVLLARPRDAGGSMACDWFNFWGGIGSGRRTAANNIACRVQIWKAPRRVSTDASMPQRRCRSPRDTSAPWTPGAVQAREVAREPVALEPMALREPAASALEPETPATRQLEDCSCVGFGQ